MNICHASSDRVAIDLQHCVCEKEAVEWKMSSPTRPHKRFWILSRLESEAWAAPAQTWQQYSIFGLIWLHGDRHYFKLSMIMPKVISFCFSVLCYCNINISCKTLNFPAWCTNAHYISKNLVVNLAPSVISLLSVLLVHWTVIFGYILNAF